MTTDSQHLAYSRGLAAALGNVEVPVARASVCIERYKRENYSETSMLPGMIAQIAKECAAHYAEIARIATEIHRNQIAMLAPPEPAAIVPVAPPKKPQPAEPIVHTEDELRSLAPVAEPPAVPAARPALNTNWNSNHIIATATAPAPAPVAASAQAPAPASAPANATEQFRHDPKVVEAAPSGGAAVNIGNGIMMNVPRATGLVPNTITMLGPHHFVVPIPGFNGSTHYVHTPGMGRSHPSVQLHTQIFNPSLGRTKDGFFINPFGPGGSGVGTKIVRNMPMMIFLGAPDAGTQEILIRQRITYTALPFNLRSADEFKASLARMDEHNMENLKQVVAFFTMLFAAASRAP